MTKSGGGATQCDATDGRRMRRLSSAVAEPGLFPNGLRVSTSHVMVCAVHVALHICDKHDDDLTRLSIGRWIYPVLTGFSFKTVKMGFRFSGVFFWSSFWNASLYPSGSTHQFNQFFINAPVEPVL